MSAETAAVLDEAADIIERNGLHKGSFGAGGPGDERKQACCAYGAINLASGGDAPRCTNPKGEAAFEALTRYLGLSDEIDNCVADWNDEPDRTVEEVLAALRGAAQAERETS